MALPKMTEEQRMAALEAALQARRARGAFLEKVPQRVAKGAGAHEILEEALADGTLARMRARQFVRSFPKIGKARAEKVLEGAAVDGARRLSGTGPKQREAMCRLIDATVHPEKRD